MSDPFVGRTIAHYEVVARVGGGAMGVVYQARDTKLGRLVALKFLPQQWSHDETAKQRFVREAQAASATNHPNICTIHDIETAADGQLFIVMAFYEGPTLKQRLESGQVAIDEALEIATQIADGLAKAHAQGVVHRDIKPGNVILTEEGVRVLDFGLATFVDALKLTAENASFGTPAYMSPEQVRGQATDARSDVWAVGVVLYEMLAGHVPFQGSHAEAIAHAIRHEAPEPLRSIRPEIPEEVEQLVFRALHKDPTIRFPSGRELTRALRQVRGLSVPIEFRTQPIPGPMPRPGPPVRDWRKRLTWATALLTFSIVAGVWWVFRPVDRIAVAVVPVANQSGYPELEPFRLALTYTLVQHLQQARDVHVPSYSKLLQSLRRFLAAGEDVSSRDVIQAIRAQNDRRIIVASTLLYANGWYVRVEFLDSTTGRPTATLQTVPIPSTLHKETTFASMEAVARLIEQRFSSRRSRFAAAVLQFVGWGGRARGRIPRSLDAVKAFEEGIRAYDDLEYAAARDAFISASKQDPRNALVLAWTARVSRLMRLDNDALRAADEALLLVTDQTSGPDRLFIEAVVAEARRDATTAEARYRAWLGLDPTDSERALELAAVQDRRIQNAEAIASYHHVLSLDGRLARPHLELCRLYNRVNDSAKAREHVDLALGLYRGMGARGGEAQSLLCLSDALRLRATGDPDVRRHAEEALEIFRRSGYSYNLARAYNYVGLAAGTQGQRREAVAFFDEALALARQLNNVGFQARVLTNLGVTHEALAHRAIALDYYQQSYKLNEVLGDEQEAARSRVNAAFISIQFGSRPEEGLRDTEHALGVFHNLEDRTFEVTCLRLKSIYLRYVGRYSEAETELNRAIDIAKVHNLANPVGLLRVELARLHFDRNEYSAAQVLLRQVIDAGPGPSRIEARILLGRVRIRLGDLSGAETELTGTAKELMSGDDEVLVPQLDLARGELAYEQGQLRVAQSLFIKASPESPDQLENEAAGEARAYSGRIEGLLGGRQGAQGRLRAAADQSRTMRRLGLEMRARLYLVGTHIADRSYGPALEALSAITKEGEQALGSEMQAYLHAARGQALAMTGDHAGARREAETSMRILEDLQRSLPAGSEAGFAARRDIRAISALVVFEVRR